MKIVALITMFGLLSILAASTKTVEAEGNNVLKVGDSVIDLIEEYSIEDQHGVLRILSKDTEEIIISFDMKLSKKFHKWLNEKESNYLSRNKAEYIIDIREMPSIITWLFAGPKMRKYGFRILLIKEGDLGDRFPKEEGSFTVIKLGQDQKVTNIRFIDNIDSLTKYIEVEVE